MDEVKWSDLIVYKLLVDMKNSFVHKKKISLLSAGKESLNLNNQIKMNKTMNCSCQKLILPRLWSPR